MSLDNLQNITEGLTYDDVLLVPAYSEVLPRDVVLESKFSRNITIKTPILSSAMDTVTEYKLAIAIAQQGVFVLSIKTCRLPIKRCMFERLSDLKVG